MKMVRTVVFCLALGLFASGCSLTGGGSSGDPAPAPSQNQKTISESYEQVNFYYDFEDVLIPNDLKYDDEGSFILETRQFRTGMLVFTGSVDHLSLVDFFISNMSKDGWEKEYILKDMHSVLTFNKPGKSCFIRITNETFGTHVQVMVVEQKPGATKVQSNVNRVDLKVLKEKDLPK